LPANVGAKLNYQTSYEATTYISGGEFTKGLKLIFTTIQL